MDAKQLQQANKHLVKIKELDAEIIQIERLGSMIASGAKSKFELKVFNPKTEEKKQDVLDADGSIIDWHRENMRRHHTFAPVISFDFGPAPTQDKSDTIKYELVDTTALQVLGVILHDKQQERAIRAQKLRDLGVNI